MRTFLALLAMGGLATAATMLAQPNPSAPTSSDPTDGPRTTRAVAYYDPALRRVVLVGGPSEPRAAQRDHVWSWSGARWESLTAAGPSGRGNGAVAYDALRGVAVVNGGAQHPGDGPHFEIVGDTWSGTPAGWQRLAGADLAPRDHHAMVYDEGRKAVILFGGIAGDRSAPWPSDTWQLEPAGWTRIAQRPGGVAAPGLRTTPRDGTWCSLAAWARRPPRISRSRFSATPGCWTA